MLTAVILSILPMLMETGPAVNRTPPAAGGTHAVTGATPPAKRPSMSMATRPSGTTSRPAQATTTSAPAPSAADRTVAAQTVTFATADNLVLSAAYTPPLAGAEHPAPMAILLHMYGTDHRDFDPLIPYLHRAGFATLAIDLRGHGDSVGPSEMELAQRVAKRDKKLFQQMDIDVRAAYDWLAEQPGVDRCRFVLVGASVGCTVALDYAAQDRSVDAVACLTPGTYYLGIDTLAPARKYAQRRLLLTAAQNERAACEELAKIIPDAVVKIVTAGTSGDPLSLHGTRLLGRVPGIEREIAQFLKEAAGAPSINSVIASMQGEVYHMPESSSARQISPRNIRWFSSPEEAEARGLRPPKVRSSGSRSRGGGSAGEPFPDPPGRSRRR